MRAHLVVKRLEECLEPGLPVVERLELRLDHGVRPCRLAHHGAKVMLPLIRVLLLFSDGERSSGKGLDNRAGRGGYSQSRELGR
jgi:hypothetical protein